MVVPNRSRMLSNTFCTAELEALLKFRNSSCAASFNAHSFHNILMSAKFVVSSAICYIKMLTDDSQ